MDSQNSGTIQQAELRIEGMHCKSCVLNIQEALMDLPGVSAAEVDLAHERGVVRFDPALTPLTQLTTVIEGLGFRATPLPHSAS